MKLRRKERRFLAIILALVMVVGMIPANQITAYAGEVVSKVWNFRGGQDGAFAETVEGTTGEFDGIIIDATSGKCSARTQGDTQINEGTVLNIPVSGKGTVTVKTYPGYHGYEINGMAADADEYTYTYEGSAGYVTLTATSQMYLYEVATLCVSSNSGASNICVESPSGKVDSQVYDRSEKGTVLNFYASEDGIYKVYSSNEKLLLARAYREHTKTVEVTGTVTAPSTLSNCEIAFENAKTGEVTTAKAVDGKYTVSLNEQYDYNVSLVNANGYVIASDKTLAIAKNAKNVTFDVAVNAVELVTVTGKVTGLDSDALAKLEVTLESDNIYTFIRT